MPIDFSFGIGGPIQPYTPHHLLPPMKATSPQPQTTNPPVPDWDPEQTQIKIKLFGFCNGFYRQSKSYWPSPHVVAWSRGVRLARWLVLWSVPKFFRRRKPPSFPNEIATKLTRNFGASGTRVFKSVGAQILAQNILCEITNRYFSWYPSCEKTCDFSREKFLT